MEVKWFSVKKKLILFSLLLLLIPLSIIMFFANGKVRETTEREYVNSSLREIEKVDNAISMYFKGIKEDLNTLATDPRMLKADSSIMTYKDIKGNGPLVQMTPSKNGAVEKEIYEAFSHFGKNHPDATYVYMGTEEGRYVQYPEGPTLPGYDPRMRPWYVTALEDPGEVLMTGAYTSSGLTHKIVSNVVTIERNGKRIGVMGLDVSLDGLTSLIQDVKIGGSGYVILTQSDGTIIAHPKKPELNLESISELNIPELGAIGQDGTFEAKVDGEESVLHVITSENNNWKYISIIEKKDLAASANQIGHNLLIIGSLVVIIAIVISVFIIIRFTNNFRKLAKEMRKLEKLKTVSEIAASISHEVRNPLTVIKGFLQLLKERNLTEEDKMMYLAISLDELERAEHIITDYLTFAKPSLENVKVLDLAKELDYVLTVVSPYANMNNVHIEVSWEENLYISGEAAKLHQCLINVIKNGIEAMPEGGQLSVSLKKTGSKAWLSVTDSGTGMSEEQLERLGTPFYTTKDKGTGLGTMVVYSIVKAMGGEIKVKSEENKGTSFTIALPIAQNSQPKDGR
ncbi:sensor histidine kinase [Domibacillus sp. A3M-37]|uniref:sensor histidine kinase n=1 Tax=Domibacillus sp. A3M-37 TaxID=2962037 RepID=UPI0020B69B19|nr:sensor histidine kinase [Domibacillus sp. A3M-37]MCP3764052.1 sensor histidine kinase [Domibacillus sp. A3M-37]